MFLRLSSTKKLTFHNSGINNIFVNRLVGFDITYKYLFPFETLKSVHTINAEIKPQTRNGYVIMNEMPHKYSLAKRGFESQPLDDNSHDIFIKKLNTQWSTESFTNVFESFRWLSNYASIEQIEISSNVFDDFIDTLADNIQDFSDSELEILLRDLEKWPKVHKNTRNLIELWSALDDVLLERYSSFDENKLLLFLDYFHSMGIISTTGYPKKAINRLTRKYKKLSTSHFVQTAYYISVTKVPPYDFHNLEVRFKEIFDSLTIDELVVISSGFAKSIAPLREAAFIETFIERIISDADKLDDFGVFAVLELLSFSAKTTVNNSLDRLSDTLLKELYRFNPAISTLVAGIGVKTTLYKRDVLITVAKIVIDNISILNMKHFERILHAFATFNVENSIEETLTNAIIEELRSPRMKNLHEQQRMCFINCVYNLVTMRKYPYDLIDTVLNPEFLFKVFKKNYTTGSPALRIEVAVDIDCEDYHGKHMENVRRYNVAMKCCDYIPQVGGKYNLNMAETCLLETIVLVENIRGKEFSYTGYLLPNFPTADIVICNDPNGEPVKVTQHYPEVRQFGTILYAPDKVNTWIALVIADSRHYTANTGELLRNTQLKIDFLKKIGYTPILIPVFEWEKINKHKQIEFLNEKISAALT